MKRSFITPLILVLALAVYSCSKNRSNLLVNNWEEINHDMSLDINPDSTLSVKEYKNSNEGNWSLSDDRKTFIVRFKGVADKELQIKALTKDSLVLSDNGLDMIFKSKGVRNP